jgi:hypothetical protein
MKMGRRLRCSSVTYQSRYAPSLRRQLPDRRSILIATKATLFMGQDTSPTDRFTPAKYGRALVRSTA